MPDGRRRGHEYVARNPLREDRRAGTSASTSSLAAGPTSRSAPAAAIPYPSPPTCPGSDRPTPRASSLRCWGCTMSDLAGMFVPLPADHLIGTADGTPLGQTRVVSDHARPDDAPLSIPRHRLGEPSAVWDYRDAAGRLLSRVCRWDHADGDKTIIRCPTGRTMRAPVVALATTAGATTAVRARSTCLRPDAPV